MLGNRMSLWHERALVGAVVLAVGIGAAEEASGDLPPIAWKAATSSPRLATVDKLDAPLLAACGGADGALSEAAARTARRQVDGGSLPSHDEIAFNLRAAGDPHLTPRAWSLAGSDLDDEDMVRRIKAWVAPWNMLGVRRCGAARVPAADGTTVVAVIAIDALADLSPLPTTARVGQWITLDGAMLVPASAVKVVLLGPRGAPKTVPASLAGDRIHATFAVDQPGGWIVQVLATVSTGPHPVLEAAIYAGSSPPGQFVLVPAPGESASQGAKDDDDAMLRMINAARASESLSPLVRDSQLDKLAKVHSEEMLKARIVGHDVGSGDVVARLRAAGVSQHMVAENVAVGSTLENAHRVLWSSPSHRGNLLLDQFAHIGVGVLRASEGRVWVTEIFSD